jgi:hypothetical protein
LIPPFDPDIGGLPPGDHRPTLEGIAKSLGFTPRRRWLLKDSGLQFKRSGRAGIEEMQANPEEDSRSFFGTIAHSDLAA